MASNTTTKVDVQVTIEDLPITFKVKYMGQEPSQGLWGIKYTRRPVDIMVAKAKKLSSQNVLPICELTVSVDGINLVMITSKMLTTTSNTNKSDDKRNWNYPVDTISYGVQDLVYTRVFAMIVVNDEQQTTQQPFDVHGFVCDSRAMARKLTYALAAAFQNYSRRVKETNNGSECNDRISVTRKRFAIDIRSPEELASGMDNETEA